MYTQTHTRTDTCPHRHLEQDGVLRVCQDGRMELVELEVEGYRVTWWHNGDDSW